MKRLSELFQIRRRFLRSVNLERDGDNPDALEGYVLTPRSAELTDRILTAYSDAHRTRAWTLTGVYGTGKSSFANFLSAVAAPAGTGVREAALQCIENQAGDSLASTAASSIPEEGLVRAVVTATREPVAQAALRALARGCERFWAHRPGRKPNVVKQVARLADGLPDAELSAGDLANLTRDVAEASGSGVLLLFDELGKILEHTALTGGKEDLYLLQQLAEMPAGPADPPVLVVGLLHQAFSEYGNLLSTAEQAEWGKIQGRFEDVPFTEPTEQMLRLIGHAVDFCGSKAERVAVRKLADRWSARLAERGLDPYVTEVLTPERLQDVLPLHPVAALALPTLCARYGQNERSLFTFLASAEPNSLMSFLQEEQKTADLDLPVLGLTAVYDFFVDAANMSLGNRVQMSRWSEVDTVVRDAKGLAQDRITVLKTVGALNLVASGGGLRASHGLVLAALADAPDQVMGSDHWVTVIEDLVSRGFLAYRKQIDEYRVWQGSDFDIDLAVQEQLEGEQGTPAQVLQSLGPRSPVVAQRHSYQSGTLRYYEQAYADLSMPLERLKSTSEGSDGVVAYWVGRQQPEHVPERTKDGLPLVVVVPRSIEAVVSAAMELTALVEVEKTEAALQADGIGRKELKKRILIAREVLERALAEAFEHKEERTVWARGERIASGNFNALLSTLLDESFFKGPVLWNEIINRRKLTSQGSKAQRELLTALVEDWATPRLGIEGSGPDYSIYASVFEAGKIHRQEDGVWVIRPPVDSDDVALAEVWEAVENFLLSAGDKPKPLGDLYALLKRPPYGVREGLIPLLIAAVLIYRSEDVSIYQEGSFVPVLMPAHLELLVKRPELFSVKHFELGGVRFSEYRKVLEQIGSSTNGRLKGVRNQSLLNVVRPLIQFAVALPKVTQQTKRLTGRAREVLDALLSSREPDDLIFSALPAACGYEPFVPGELRGTDRRSQFIDSLAGALRELQTHYEQVLDRCEQLIHHAFGVQRSVGKLREDLRVRGHYLAGGVIEPRLNSFVQAVVDEEASDKEWLESLVMIIADRPAETWSDDDLSSFELNLGELARRFKNLEALRTEAATRPQEGFDAKRVAITSGEGHQTDRVVWVERESQDQIKAKARELMDHLSKISETRVQEAILVEVLEELLATTDSVQVGRQADHNQQKEKHA